MTTLGPGERTHAWLDVLPNGKGVLVTVIPSESGDQRADTIAVADFATGKLHSPFPGTYARYAASGHVVFVQADGTLLAAPFDHDRSVAGVPVALLQGVQVG